jgi:hypothetical protein
VDGRLRGSERETALEARVTSRSFRPRGSLTGAPLRWGEGEMLALQRRVGNDAVRTLAEGRVVLQRQGAPEAMSRYAWAARVREPLWQAVSGMTGPPDYQKSYLALSMAYDALGAEATRLGASNDPRLADVQKCRADIKTGAAYLGAKLGNWSDEYVQKFLRGVYNEAELVGEKLGWVEEALLLLEPGP